MIKEILKYSLFFLIAMSVIAILKITFGGDFSSISVSNVLVGFMYVIPICVVTAIGVVMHQRKANNNKEEDH